MSKELKSANKRITALENENKKLHEQMNNLQSQVTKNTRDIDNLKTQNIISCLTERNIPGDPNSKPRYSYEEIANMFDTNPTQICRIAKENNIERRNKKNA